MSEMLNHFWFFLAAVGKQYILLASGGVLTVVIALIERHVLKRQISYKSEIAVLSLFIFAACFGAWDSEYRKVHEVPIQPQIIVNVPQQKITLEPAAQAELPKASPATISFIDRGILTNDGMIERRLTVTAHGTIQNPAFRVHCEPACRLNGEFPSGPAQFEARGYGMGLIVEGDFLMPAKLTDGQQVILDIRPLDGKPVKVTHVTLIKPKLEANQ